MKKTGRKKLETWRGRTVVLVRRWLMFLTLYKEIRKNALPYARFFVSLRLK
jgi:hypothetical protein